MPGSKNTLTRRAEELEAYYVVEPDETGNGNPGAFWREEGHPYEIALVFRALMGMP